MVLVLVYVSNSVMIFITFKLLTVRKISAEVLQLSNTYKPNYKELEIELLGTFFSSIMDHIPLKLDTNAYLQ